jgi:hypothetical protein
MYSNFSHCLKILIPDLGAKNRHLVSKLVNLTRAAQTPVPGHILQIHGGTPSIIPRTPPRRAARSPPRTTSRAARDVANDRPYGLGVAVRAAAPSSQIPSRAATRVKPRDPLRHGMGGQAFRVHRVPALSDNDLYLTQMRPPAKSSPLPHHKCNICHGMKSHPVS